MPEQDKPTNYYLTKQRAESKTKGQHIMHRNLDCPLTFGLEMVQVNPDEYSFRPCVHCHPSESQLASRRELEVRRGK